ncbi:hypothetical protein N7540_012966 [Penicillium herquei]|nr:hypothetical protein N7540_012966 [Penicillium herquei]
MAPRRPCSPIFDPVDSSYDPVHRPIHQAPIYPSRPHDPSYPLPPDPYPHSPPYQPPPPNRTRERRSRVTIARDSPSDTGDDSSSHEYSIDMTPQFSQTRPEVKFLYNHSAADDRRVTWSEFEDPREEEARTRAATGCYAVVHRRKKASMRDESPWKTDSFVVNGAALRGVLKQVFKDYPHWMKDREPFVFRPPFQQFFHRWEEIKTALNQNESVKNEGAILTKELMPWMERHRKDLDAIIQQCAVAFDDLWLIYPPGETVVRTVKGQPSACNIVRTEIREDIPGSRELFIQLKQFDWNGSYCGFNMSSTSIISYEDVIPVASLEMVPLKFKGDAQAVEALQEKLLRRGRKFEAMRGFHIMKCRGSKFLAHNDNSGITEHAPRPISGRVIIDAYAFHHCQEYAIPVLRRSDEDEPPTDTSSVSEEYFRTDPTVSDERDEDLRSLTDIECILSVAHVKGFDLTKKQWCEFNIDELHDPEWSDVPYDKLVLPADEKQLILAMADRERRNKTGFDDFVDRKGRGIIFLLCGQPGVGKTLTAEAVADKYKIPLYILGANDLGTNARQVDNALESAFACCRLWGALLLIDEADVFLEERSSDDLHRNELVAVLLRRLEYYEGLMFLTTNRTKSIDDAFLSRMDLILRYPNLDDVARRTIWHSFLDRLGESAHSITEDDLDELKECNFNGREIKNLIKTACVLAVGEGKLTMENLRTVIRVRQRI